MSATVDQFCDKLRERLTAMEGRLQTAQRNLKTLSGQAEKAVRDKLDDARRKVAGQKEHMDQIRDKLKAGAQQKVAEAKEKVGEWKAKGEKWKLQARAERAEAYAADAIDYAVAAVDEAEEAILDAVVARMDADGK